MSKRNRGDKAKLKLGLGSPRTSGNDHGRSRVRLGASFDSGKLMGDLVSLGRVDLSAEIDLPPIRRAPSGLIEAKLLRDGKFDQRKRILRSYPHAIKWAAWWQGQKQRPLTDEIEYDEIQDELLSLQQKATGECIESMDHLADNLELEITRRTTWISKQDGLEARLTEAWGDISRGVHAQAEQLAGFWYNAEERLRRFLRRHPEYRGLLPDPKRGIEWFWVMLGAFFFAEVAFNFVFLATATASDAYASADATPGLVELLLLPVGFAFVNVLIAFQSGGWAHEFWHRAERWGKAAAIAVGAASWYAAGVFVLALAHVRDYISQGLPLSGLTLDWLATRIFTQPLQLGFEAAVLCLLTGLLFVIAFRHSLRAVDKVGPEYRRLWTMRHQNKRRFDEFLATQLRGECRKLLTAYREAITHLLREVEEARNPIDEYVVRARHQSDDLLRRWTNFTTDSARAIRLYRRHNVEGRTAPRWFGFVRSVPTPAPAYFRDDTAKGFQTAISNIAKLQGLQADFITRMGERKEQLQKMSDALPEKEKTLDKLCDDYRVELLKGAKLQDHDSEFIAGDLSTDEDLGDNAIPFPRMPGTRR